MKKLYLKLKYRKFIFKNCIANNHRVNFNKFVGWYCADNLCQGPTFHVSKCEQLVLEQGFRVRLLQRGDYV